MADKFNLFDVLGIARMEIRHSNILGWLLDPNENHGLGDAVIRGFLSHVATASGGGVDVFDVLLLDCHDFTVRREWRNIDILAVSASEKYAICIENKIGTGERDNQLNRYRGIIKTQYPAYRHAFVYLSPDGSEPSDPEHWCAMSYRDVLDVIEAAKAKTRLLPDIELLVDNYIETIRRDVVGDERLEQICAEIYSKHRRHSTSSTSTAQTGPPHSRRQSAPGPSSATPRERSCSTRASATRRTRASRLLA